MNISNKKKLKLVYIMSPARSGSTILDITLANIKGINTVGEMWFLWRRGIIENRYCGCGKRFKNCDFWSGKFKLTNLTYKESIKIDKQLESRTKTGFYKSLIGKKNETNELVEYLDKIYLNAAKASNSNVIIDSSKWPTYALLLKQLPSFDLYVVNLIRDPRAVTYSWSKKKKYAPHEDSIHYFKRLNLVQAVFEWSVWIITMNIISLFLTKKILIKYEDYAENPKKTIDFILKFINEDDKPNPIQNNAIYLDNNHSISGNPIRFKRGVVKIKLDEEWKDKQSGLKNYIITIFTAPFLLRYGYKFNYK